MSHRTSAMARCIRGRTCRSSWLLPLLFAVAVACGRSDSGRFVSVSRAAATAIAFVQTNNATPQTPAIGGSVPFTLAQSAGNLKLVAVGRRDTIAPVASATDTQGTA